MIWGKKKVSLYYDECEKEMGCKVSTNGERCELIELIASRWKTEALIEYDNWGGFVGLDRKGMIQS